MAGAIAIDDTTPRPRRRRRGLAIVLAVVVGWLVVGAVRAPAIARDYYLGRQGPANTVTNLEVHTAIPLIPPFWGVSIDGDVSEPQMHGQAYVSAMLLCIEPFTGFVIVCGSG
jgi:hypothetical protein